MNEERKAAFSPQDLKVIKLLAVALGVVACGELWIATSTEMRVLAVGLNGVTLVVALLAIYLLRRVRARR